MVWPQRRPMLSACPVVQRCRCELGLDPTGHSDIWKPFHCPRPPARQLTALHLGTKTPPSPLALMSWSHPHMFGLHRLGARASWREWIKGWIDFFYLGPDRAETKSRRRKESFCCWWINTDDLHSQGLITIVLGIWHWSQMPTQKCIFLVCRPRVLKESAVHMFQSQWPWLNPEH